MKKLNTRLREMVLLGITASASLVGAESSGQKGDEISIRELKAQIQELDQKLCALERNRELDKNEFERKTKEAPKISVSERGFSLSSPDGAFALNLRGVLQIDSRTFTSDNGNKSNDGFLLRRARPVLQGTLFHGFDFLFVPDFGTGSNGGNNGSPPTPQIYDAYLNYQYRPELQLRFGKFKSPVGLEQLVVDVDTLFNERALATGLTPNRDLGFELHGEILDGVFDYAVGIFNGVGDARNSSGSDLKGSKEFAGRLFAQPFRKSLIRAMQGFGIRPDGSYGEPSTVAALPATTGGTFPGYATDGQQQFFAYNSADKSTIAADGVHWRLSPQASYYYGPFGFLGEYVLSKQRVSRTVIAPLVSASLANMAWEITGSWILTGEDAAYRGGVNPRKPFDPFHGHWGALQFVARFAELDIDKAAFPFFSDRRTSAASASGWSIGLNWYLNRNVALKTSFSRTEFGAGGSDVSQTVRGPEDVFFTRLQVAF